MIDGCQMFGLDPVNILSWSLWQAPVNVRFIKSVLWSVHQLRLLLYQSGNITEKILRQIVIIVWGDVAHQSIVGSNLLQLFPHLNSVTYSTTIVFLQQLTSCEVLTQDFSLSNICASLINREDFISILMTLYIGIQCCCCCCRITVSVWG